MTNKQILEKAIDKAIDSGFKIDNEYWFEELDDLNIPAVIFSHDFAKAFWGEEVLKNVGGFDCMLSWAYYLQQMVLEEEPLKYLEKFL